MIDETEDYYYEASKKEAESVAYGCLIMVVTGLLIIGAVVGLIVYLI